IHIFSKNVNVPFHVRGQRVMLRGRSFIRTVGDGMRLYALTTPAVLAAAAAIVPAGARASVMVNVDHVRVLPRPVDQTVYLDAYLTDLDGANERMSAFALALNGPANKANGVRFVAPVGPPVSHTYFLARFPGSGPD